MSTDGLGELDFDKFARPPGPGSCAACLGDMGSTFYRVNASDVCERCAIRLRDGDGTRVARVLRALAFGGGAMIASTIVWYAIRAITGYELGLIAIGVGLAVGMAVRRGSDHRGGAGFQALAMFLTYAAIALTYVPDVVSGMLAPDAGQVAAAPADALTTIVATIIAIPLSFIIPVGQLFEGGIMGFIILGIALFEAWKVNQRQLVFVEGPFSR